MSQQDHLAFEPQPDPGFGRALTLALFVHAILILALTWGITWRNKPQDVAVDAEIWSSIPEPVVQSSAEPVPPPPVTEPEPPPQPKPEPVKPPPPDSTQPAPPDKAKIDADIAIDKKKKGANAKRSAAVKAAATKGAAAKAAVDKAASDKAAADKAAADKAAAEKAAADKAAADKAAADKAAADKAAADKAAADKAAADKAAADKAAADKAAADKAAHDRDEQKRKEEPAKPSEEDIKLQQEKEREAKERREAERKRLREMAQNATGPTEKPGAAKATTLSGNYLAKLRGRVRPNIRFTESQMQAVKGNPEAEIEVTCNSAGKILSKKLMRSSGNKAWDDAVLDAIEKTGILPQDENGVVPQTLSFGFRPRD